MDELGRRDFKKTLWNQLELIVLFHKVIAVMFVED